MQTVTRRWRVCFVSCCYFERPLDSLLQEGDENRYDAGSPEAQKAVKAWVDYQDGQKILLTTPTVLVGYRLKVYRAEGTTQWYTAVIQSYNHTTKVALLLWRACACTCVCAHILLTGSLSLTTIEQSALSFVS